MLISDGSSDVCSAELDRPLLSGLAEIPGRQGGGDHARPVARARLADRTGVRLSVDRRGTAAQHLVARRNGRGGIGADRRAALRLSGLCRGTRRPRPRSEEPTSELQSLMRISYAVFCLKKKNN